jgi:hypothetical protein
MGVYKVKTQDLLKQETGPTITNPRPTKARFHHYKTKTYKSKTHKIIVLVVGIFAVTHNIVIFAQCCVQNCQILTEFYNVCFSQTNPFESLQVICVIC